MDFREDAFAGILIFLFQMISHVPRRWRESSIACVRRRSKLGDIPNSSYKGRERSDAAPKRETATCFYSNLDLFRRRKIRK